MRFSDTIDAFRQADGPPPSTLLAFFRWALSGSMPVLLIAGAISAASGTLEVVTALLLGVVIDAALGSGPGAFFGENLWVIVAVTGSS